MPVVLHEAKKLRLLKVYNIRYDMIMMIFAIKLKGYDKSTITSLSYEKMGKLSYQ